jgi:hypothetical protein
MQLQEDFHRSEFQAIRVEEKNEITTRIAEAKANEAYFLDVIHYYDTKIGFFEGIEGALDLS